MFAAGDCATVSGGIAGAAVLGHIAGEGAVERIRQASGALPEVDGGTLDALRERCARHLDQPQGLAWKTFEDEVRQTVTDYVGVRRNDKGLRLALATLQALARREPELKADDLHGLMRVHEACNIRMNAEIMAAASLERTETRTGSSYWRFDYPKPDEANWRRFVLVERGTSGPEVRTLSTEQPLAAGFARAALTA